MQTMAELQFHFGILEADKEVMRVPLASDSAVFIFLDGSAIYMADKTMTVIPDIWDERQGPHLEHCLPARIRREKI